MRGVVTVLVVLWASPVFGQFAPAQMEKFERAVDEAEAADRAANLAVEALRDAKVGHERLGSEATRLLKIALARRVTPESVKAIFGAPDGVEVDTCGEKSPSGPWTCKILKYGNSHFYFGKCPFTGQWVLNNFEIGR